MVEIVERGKPLLYDGSGIIGDCNFCGRSDIVVPTSTLYLCIDCLKRGDWKAGIYMSKVGMRSRVKVVRGYATCNICGVLSLGYVAIVEGWVCFRCLWTKIAKRSDALRPEGLRIV